MLKGLSARVHILAQPSSRDGLIALFKDVLKCNVAEHDFGMASPIVLVSFEDGSSFSIEFTDEPPAGCSTWLEFRAADVSAVQQRLRDVGIREFQHRGSPHVYFSAPGGQVFRIVAASPGG